MTDPIAAMITMIKNASHAGKAVVTVPHSQVKEAIVVCLKRNGFVANFETKIRDERPYLDITLAAKNGDRINDVTRVSKPSRRMYKGVKEIRMYKNGAGSFVFSTPKGILTDKEARKEMVGGEIMFSIW
ncbi:MAG: 30S ribosomal protein S8 [Candidatus Pacebacteria bacterium]|jgi:small subunit ribosomal protein S8|nr:30S ribosomal protein S8 [Candidatus Paceibacterota bacterium]